MSASKDLTASSAVTLDDLSEASGIGEDKLLSRLADILREREVDEEVTSCPQQRH